jgi:hypothetical protein
LFHSPAKFTLSQVSLAPNETTEVDLKPLLHAARKRHDLDVVSVEVTNWVGPGSIIGSLYGINDATGVNDVVGYNIALPCPPPFTASMTQSFKVIKDSTTYALSTTNAISMGRNSDGTKFVNVTISQ